MTNFCPSSFFQTYLNRMLSRTLVVGAFATIGLLSGLVPDLSGHYSALNFSSSVYAQSTISEQEVKKFATAALEVERERQRVTDNIKKINRGNVPELGCDQPERVEDLPRDIRSLVVEFCNSSREIIRTNELEVRRFNEIMINRQKNPDLRQRIEDELLRLQTGSSSQ